MNGFYCDNCRWRIGRTTAAGPEGCVMCDECREKEQGRGRFDCWMVVRGSASNWNFVALVGESEAIQLREALNGDEDVDVHGEWRVINVAEVRKAE